MIWSRKPFHNICIIPLMSANYMFLPPKKEAIDWSHCADCTQLAFQSIFMKVLLTYFLMGTNHQKGVWKLQQLSGLWTDSVLLTPVFMCACHLRKFLWVGLCCCFLTVPCLVSISGEELAQWKMQHGRWRPARFSIKKNKSQRKLKRQSERAAVVSRVVSSLTLTSCLKV